jgi:hypothetical protein
MADYFTVEVIMAEDLAAGMVEDRNDDKDSGPVFGY